MQKEKIVLEKTKIKFRKQKIIFEFKSSLDK